MDVGTLMTEGRYREIAEEYAFVLDQVGLAR